MMEEKKEERMNNNNDNDNKGKNEEDVLHHSRSGDAVADVVAAERERNERFMRMALEEARLAYEEGEVPVGCVFVREGTIVFGRGHNRTNLKKDATAHAELEAIDEVCLSTLDISGDTHHSADHPQQQQQQPLSLFRGTELYVTVEPCVMCASALLRLGLKRVYFGCHNDRFGGCGSIYSIHSTIPHPPQEAVSGQVTLQERGDEVFEYECVTGVLKEEAILLLRKFYARENTNAPPTKRRPKGSSTAEE